MSDVDSALYLDSLSVRCRISDLSIRQADPQGQEEIERIVMGDRPFSVQLTVEFLGNTAIALLMLEPTLSVELLANPRTSGDAVELGKIHHPLMPNERVYRPTLELAPPTQLAISSGLYHLVAVIRIGAENGPALLCGALKGRTFEIYSPLSELNSPSPQQKNKTSARKRTKLT